MAQSGYRCLSRRLAATFGNDSRGGIRYIFSLPGRLAVVKICGNREKDRRFIRAVLSTGTVNFEKLRELALQLPVTRVDALLLEHVRMLIDFDTR